MQNQECVDFIASVPTVWDETIALDGKLGEYAVIARRKGDTWYIGAITNWEARTVEIEIPRFARNDSNVIIYCDGVNAERNAEDYRIIKDIREFRNNRDDEDFRDNKITIELKSGGGAVVIIQ